MPLQNRVLPTGEIVATSDRGTMMGNRGILHEPNQTLTNRRWQHPHWVTCVLAFKNRRRELMQPRRYTELFFLDEATALAAGHRPCGECRRAAFQSFKSLFQQAHGDLTLKGIDKAMQRDRVRRDRRHVRHKAKLDVLPDGAFVQFSGQPYLVWDGHLLRYSTKGYLKKCTKPPGDVTVLTPACTLSVLALGYRPEVHISAHNLSDGSP